MTASLRIKHFGLIFVLLGVSVPAAAQASPCPVDIRFVAPAEVKTGSRFNLLVVLENLSSCRFPDLLVVGRVPGRTRFRRSNPVADHHRERSRVLIWESIRLGKLDLETLEIGFDVQGPGGEDRSSEYCMMSEHLDQGIFCKSFQFRVN